VPKHLGNTAEDIKSEEFPSNIWMYSVVLLSLTVVTSEGAFKVTKINTLSVSLHATEC